MRKILPLLALTPLLASCGIDPLSGGVATNLALGGATVLGYSIIGKSPSDYALSEYLGKDCDIRNPKQYEGLYCVDGKYQPAPEPVVYCYRSLGDVDCSDRVDPYGNRNAPIVRNPPNTTIAGAVAAPLPNSAAPPIPAPTMLEPAGTRPVARPATTTPAAPNRAPSGAASAPLTLTPDDMAIKGS